VTAAILCIGTELTRGEIENTNATWLARSLTDAGVEVGAVEVVPDDPEQLIRVLRRLGDAHDHVVATGGLGPTTDDLTTECAATAVNVPLVRDEASLAIIEERVTRRGRKMTASNAKQADFPAGAAIIANANGTAPGFAVTIGRARAFFMPGVPSEMAPMFENLVLPELAPADDERGVPVQVRLRTFGMPESAVNDALAGLEREHVVTLAYRAHFPEIEVKVVARDNNRVLSADRARGAADAIREKLGDVVFGEGKTDLWDDVVQCVRARRWKLATAESCTGGMVAELITSSAGVSDCFVGSIVSYSNDVKSSLLHVDPDTLATHGAVSEPVARAMAEGARRALGADIVISLTGIAGPGGGTPEKPVGLVHYACALPTHTVHRSRVFTGQRWQVRRISAFAALDLARRELRTLDGPSETGGASTQ
jgi:nicotinamide-nucleotide amidase